MGLTRPPTEAALQGPVPWRTVVDDQMLSLCAGCNDLEIIGLAHLYSAHCREHFLLPGHHGYPRASDLIRDKALEGRKYIKITDETVSPSPQSNLQTSAGIFRFLSPLTLAIHLGRSLDGFSHARLRRRRFDTRLNASLIATSLRQDSPSDPRQLVGERNCQNITMQSPRCGGEPRSKAVFHPTCRSQEDGAGALDEEHA